MNKCPYRKECEKYNKDGYICSFLNEYCLLRKELKSIEILTDVYLSLKGIEGCINERIL